MSRLAGSFIEFLYNKPVPAFFVQNFGCRATQADGYAVERQLAQKGLQRAPSPGEADLLVLNTCTVTAAADQDARAAIRRAHHENPRLRILVTGCYAQRAPHEVASLPGVTWVVGNSHKHLIADVVAGSAGDSTVLPPPPERQPQNFVTLESMALSAPAFTMVGDIFAHTELIAAPVFSGDELSNSELSNSSNSKTRPNLKVQDGCNNRCAFCIIPSVRGRSRSLRLERVLEEANALAAAGYREMVLSGINLGRWGRDLASPMRFPQLLRALLDHTDVEKIRISSVEPMDWSGDLIELMAGSPRIAKHAHVPLQSGSDRVLRGMSRRYRPWHYAEKIRRIREAMPEAAIGADVMAGFPGETGDLFEENRGFIERLPLTYLHVFTYSGRPGTSSDAMPDQVPVAVARERNKILRDLAAAKNLAFRRGFLGRSLEVITLNTGDDTGTDALSDNYLKVRIAGKHPPNTWMKVEITELAEESLAAVAHGRLTC